MDHVLKWVAAYAKAEKRAQRSCCGLRGGPGGGARPPSDGGAAGVSPALVPLEMADLYYT